MVQQHQHLPHAAAIFTASLPIAVLMVVQGVFDHVYLALSRLMCYDEFTGTFLFRFCVFGHS